MAPPTIDAAGVTFSYDDPGGSVEAISLVQEVVHPRCGPGFLNDGGARWVLHFDRPPVMRFEYRFELAFGDGRHETILDPANPLRAPGAFGERSVIEFPGYRAPTFVSAGAPDGPVIELSLQSQRLGADQPALLWSSFGSDAKVALPVLVVLDGVEFARFSGLSEMLDWAVSSRRLPPMRALLLHPTQRDQHYSANRAFPEALHEELLPEAARVARLAGDVRHRAALGASLAGLALLHAQRSRPGLFGAMFLQSSSFFEEGHPLGIEGTDRVERFMRDVHAAASWADPVPVEMTCGAVEMNLANNARTRTALRRQGYPAHLHVVPDAHNWIAWRDAWLPRLPAMLRKVWR